VFLYFVNEEHRVLFLHAILLFLQTTNNIYVPLSIYTQRAPLLSHFIPLAFVFISYDYMNNDIMRERTRRNSLRENKTIKARKKLNFVICTLLCENETLMSLPLGNLLSRS